MASAQPEQRGGADQADAGQLERVLELAEDAERRARLGAGDDGRDEVAERRIARAPRAARAPARGIRRRRGGPRRRAGSRPAGRSARARRPGASRPLRPASWVTSWNVRSSARKSGNARPVSASTTAATATPGKWCPFATICVPMSAAAREAANRSSASRSAPGLAAVSASSRIRSSPGTRRSSSASSRWVPAPMRASSTEPHSGHFFGKLLAEAAVVAVQAAVAMERQRHVAAPAPARVAAGAAVDRPRDAAAVQEQHRASSPLLDAGELGEQRRRERVSRLAAQVDEAHGRHRRADARRQLEPVEPRPALHPRGRAPVDGDGAFERGALRGHRARVVARVRLLLEGAVVLLVDDDQAERGHGREDGRARADDDARLARSRSARARRGARRR